jgi:hypothetical protein
VYDEAMEDNSNEGKVEIEVYEIKCGNNIDERATSDLL